MYTKRLRGYWAFVLPFAMVLLSAVPVLASGAAELPWTEARSPAMFVPNVSQYSYTIDPRYLPEGYVRLGDGVNMMHPEHPVLSTMRAFRDDGLVEADAPIADSGKKEWAHCLVSDTSVFRQSMNAEEEASVLVAYFKASYGLTSVEGAGKVASANKSKEESVYVLFEHNGNTQRANLGSLTWDWKQKPRSELMETRREALAQFLNEYGSHYVSTVTYGMRIGIRGTISNAKDEENTKFTTAMKTAFYGVGVTGGLTSEQKKVFESTNVEVILEVTSGGAIPPRPLILTGVEDIFNFLQDLRAANADGSPKLAFKLAPISANLKSYWSTLPTNWVKTRAMLRPDEISAIANLQQGGEGAGTR